MPRTSELQARAVYAVYALQHVNLHGNGLHGGPDWLSSRLPRLKVGENLLLQPPRKARNMQPSDDEEEEPPMAVALGEHKKVAKFSGSVLQKCILLTCACPQNCRLQHQRKCIPTRK